jgi:muramidase (phage lysozyme)
MREHPQYLTISGFYTPPPPPESNLGLEPQPGAEGQAEPSPEEPVFEVVIDYAGNWTIRQVEPLTPQPAPWTERPSAAEADRLFEARCQAAWEAAIAVGVVPTVDDAAGILRAEPTSPHQTASAADDLTAIVNEISDVLADLDPIGSAEAASRHVKRAKARKAAKPAKSLASTQAVNLEIAENLVKNPNIMAFLRTITSAEGAGYYDVNSGATVSNLDNFPKGTSFSSAAGAYQIMRPTFEGLANELGLKDFSPKTQDLMGAFLLYKQGAASALLNGDLPTAMLDASKQWAAVPGGPASLNHSHYRYPLNSPRAGQYQPSMDYQTFIDLYHANGGK